MSVIVSVTSGGSRLAPACSDVYRDLMSHTSLTERHLRNCRLYRIGHVRSAVAEIQVSAAAIRVGTLNVVTCPSPLLGATVRLLLRRMCGPGHAAEVSAFAHNTPFR
jgi:hypothetical protein